MKSRLKIRDLAATVAAGALVCVAGTAPAAEKIEWNFSTFGNPRAVTAGYEAAGKYLEEHSGGNFTMKIHYGESISPVRNHLDGMKIGAFEASHFCVSYHPAKTPAGGVLDLPFLPMANLDELEAVHEAFHATREVWLKDLERWGTAPWFSTILPQYEFMGTGTPPKTLDDWKGMRVRALAGIGDAMRTLGAVPTTVPAPEAYSALERGVIQAVSFPYAYTFAAYRLHEISRWFTEGLALGSVNCPSGYAIAAYNALPDEYKKLLAEAKPAAYAALKEAYAEMDVKWIPEYEKRMTKLTYTEEERNKFIENAAVPVWEAWVKDTAAKGYPAQELLDYVLAEAKKAASGS